MDMKKMSARRVGSKKIIVVLLLFFVPFTSLYLMPDRAYAFKKWAAALFGGAKEVTKAPDFELSELNGTKVSLHEFKGNRPVLLYFWATWCPSCRSAKPDVIKLREQTKEDELEILAINVGSGDSLEKVKRYQESHPVNVPVLYDYDGLVTQAYHVQGIPLFVLINDDGDIVYRDHRLPGDFSKYLN